MIRGIRLNKVREQRLAVALHRPIELPPVDQHTTKAGPVARVELRQRRHNNVGTQLQRTNSSRRRHSIVDNQRYGMLMSNLRDRGNVQDIGLRVGKRLAIKRHRVVLRGRVPRLRIIRILHERDLNPEPTERVGQQRFRAAIQARRRYDMRP